MIAAGHVRRLALAALKPERAPVLAGGLAVMAAAMEELDADRINPVGGALRLGVLYDLLGRRIQRDVRTATVDQFQTRWRVDREHAGRVAAMAQSIFGAVVASSDPGPAQRLDWAALLHETGFSVSHTGFHKHGAYILQNADMPGFSAGEQSEVAAAGAGLPRQSRQDGDRRSATRSFAPSSWRCAWPCCSTTRAGRSKRRASASVPRPASASRSRRAG